MEVREVCYCCIATNLEIEKQKQIQIICTNVQACCCVLMTKIETRRPIINLNNNTFINPSASQVPLQKYVTPYRVGPLQAPGPAPTPNHVSS